MNRACTRVLLLVALVALVACSGAVRREIFSEADVAPYRLAGTGTIEGDAIMETVRGEPHLPMGAHVWLFPATPYNVEFMNALNDNDVFFLPDEHELIVWRADVDPHGHFAFNDRPAGRYLVAAPFEWLEASWSDPVPTRSLPVYQVVDVHHRNDVRLVELADGATATVHLR